MPNPPPHNPADFGALLASLASAVEAAAPPGPDDAVQAAMAEAIRTFREGLPDMTHLGGPDDGRDLYRWLDTLIDSVKAAYPGSICRSGCSGCCQSQTAVFDASPAEWQVIATHLASAWTPERRAAFADRFRALYAPHLRAYRWLARLRFFEPLAERYWQRHPYTCPFLEDGRCSIYAARPLACRMFGYFAVRSRWYQAQAVYACRQQSAYFAGLRLGGAPVHLPSANTVRVRFRRLAGSSGRILPLWLAAWDPADRETNALASRRPRRPV